MGLQQQAACFGFMTIPCIVASLCKYRWVSVSSQVYEIADNRAAFEFFDPDYDVRAIAYRPVVTKQAWQKANTPDQILAERVGDNSNVRTDHRWLTGQLPCGSWSESRG